MELVYVAAVAGVIALWWNGMRARGAAIALVRRACRRDGLQLLDETVTLVRFRSARDPDGRFCWRRTYRFEFLAASEQRHEGRIELVGHRPAGLSLELDGFTLHENRTDDST